VLDNSRCVESRRIEVATKPVRTLAIRVDRLPDRAPAAGASPAAELGDRYAADVRLRTIGASSRERECRLPGDALLAECVLRATHAMTIAAKILPPLRRVTVGDVMPALPVATAGQPPPGRPPVAGGAGAGEQTGRRPSRPSHEIVAFPRSRRLIVDVGRVARARNTVHGFIAIDVTDVRRRLRDAGAAGGGDLSLTGYIVACVGRAVAADRAVHALRDPFGRLVRFDDVDVNVSVEVRLEGRSFPMNHVIRAAQARSLHDISAELHRVKRHPDQSPTRRLAAGARVFLSLPGVLRRSAFRALYRLPARQKALVGTVGVTAVGMVGRGGGWGTAFQVHPLEVVVGGIAVTPGVTDQGIAPREHLHVTLSFDHDVVDGAPAARFASRLRDLIEAPDVVLGAAGRVQPRAGPSDPSPT
jgi:pyruvate/2-oxoglutarate dehydrogenase complex dihydrolipoamide acyltransferase (E2) component